MLKMINGHVKEIFYFYKHIVYRTQTEIPVKCSCDFADKTKLYILSKVIEYKYNIMFSRCHHLR